MGAKETRHWTEIYGPHPATAADAKRLGTRYYLNWRPCNRGHVSVRYYHGGCVACHAEHRESNREKNRAASKKWREENPDKCKQYHDEARERGYHKEYYARTRERQIASAMEWNANNPEKHAQSVRKYHETHRDELLEKARERYRENREEILEKDRAYRRENREKLRESTRRWREENPEQARITDRNNKLRRRGAVGSHTLADIDRLRALQRHRCAECGTDTRSAGYHVDHVVPLALGGTNWPNNLQILCPKCNLEKHATDPIKFAQRKGRLL